jgi:hypothetical protein
MQITKTLIAAAGNAGGASGALYDFTNTSGTTTLFNTRTVRIARFTDDIVFHIDRINSDYSPSRNPCFGKIDQDGNLSFFREFTTSNNTVDGWSCEANCFNLDAQNNIHGLVKNNSGFNVASLKLNGSNGTDMLGFISTSNYNRNAIYGVTASIPDNQISLCWKQGSTPNSVINIYGAAGNVSYNAFSNRSWVQSSLNGQIPNGCAVIPSWTYWNFSTIYSTKYAVFTLWSNAASGAPTARGISTIADSTYTTQTIFPRITIQDPTDVNDVFVACFSYDDSSGGNCQNLCLIRFDAFYSASDLFRVYGRFAATGQNNNIQVDGAVADTVTGDNYMYVSGYFYDTVKALNVSYVICFDGATGDIVNQVKISATGNTQSVFTQGPCSIDSEGNVYTCISGQTARSSTSSIIKLPPALAISDTTAGIYDIEEMNEFALQGTNSITLYNFSATASGFGFGDQGGSNTLTSKSVSVTSTTI